MRRVLLRSPAFSRDLRSWFKSRPEYVQHEGSEAILLLALGTHDQVY